MTGKPINSIHVWDRTGKAGDLVRFCREILQEGASALKLQQHEVHLTFVTDASMKCLNRAYRKKNKPTDVLSFDQNVKLPSGVLHLGDIIIATPTARRQAKEGGRSLRDECGTLALHGLLHLLGYDHEDPSDAKIMFALQDKLCRQAGIHV